MGAWTAPLLVAGALLVVAGAPKVLDPTTTVGALRSVGLRVPSVAVRLSGAGEAVLGAASLFVGGRLLAALVATSYLGFSGFLVVALRRGGAVSSCGCVGRPDTPPTRSHVAVTAGLAIGTALAAANGAEGLATLRWSATAVTTVALCALAGWLAWLVFTALPHLLPKES